MTSLWKIILLSLICLLPFSPGGHSGYADLTVSAYASDEGACSEQQTEASCGGSEKNSDTLQLFDNKNEGSPGQLRIPLEKRQDLSSKAPKQARDDGKFVVYFFWGHGCPHCSDQKPFLEDLKKRYPGMEVKTFEVWNNKKNAALFAETSSAYGVKAAGVPMTFIDQRAFTGFNRQIGRAIESAVAKCAAADCVDPADVLSGKVVVKDGGKLASNQTTAQAGAPQPEKKTDPELSVDLPLFGSVKAVDRSLPVLTVMIAGMDSFNPCAFFVLLSLLGLMVHARSRGRMLFVGGIFVFFSGFLYFLFMAAWLNLFLVMGRVSTVTTIAGVLSLIIGAINIKDFFLFKKGVSLTIPDSAKPKLFDRMRGLLRASSVPALFLGTVVLALAANSYELLCTAGFPMVYTRILTLNNLSEGAYYFYLALYNVVYVLPLLLIVLFFAATLGKKQLTEQQGRILKLVSGVMMLALALVLLISPALLNNMGVSLMILAGSVAFSLLVTVLQKRRT